MDEWKAEEARGPDNELLYYIVKKNGRSVINCFSYEEIGITLEDAKKHAEMIADMLNKLEVENGS